MKIIQVLPNNDIRHHIPSSKCGCGARWDQDQYLVHNSFDGRELFEQNWLNLSFRDKIRRLYLLILRREIPSGEWTVWETEI